jgi:hypothetical protein
VPATTPARNRAKARKAVSHRGGLTFQEPLIEEQKPEPAPEPTPEPEPEPTPEPTPKPTLAASQADSDDRPRDHKGIPIVREELTSSLPNGAPFRISRLHLSDGTIAFACRDCLDTEDTRGAVMAHRNREHGATFGKKRPKVEPLADKFVGDLVLPPRKDGPAPSNPMEMTVAELMALLPSISAIGDLIDRMEQERDHAVNELIEREAHDRENKHKIAVYPSLQEEVVDLRGRLRGVGSFDEMKAELIELRRWKKEMIKRLSALGFTLSEEDK